MGVYLGSTQVDMQGGFVTGGASGASLQSKTVSPSESAQTIKADYGYDGLSQVTVNAVSRTYVGSGVTKKSAATYTPGTSDQSIASGQYLNGTQTIKGDSNLTAGNIRNGVSIFGVSGTYTGSSSGGSGSVSLQSKTVSPSESTQTVKPDSGYGGLSSVTVNAVSKTYVGSGVTKKAAATYTPKTSDQSIAASQYLSGAQTIKGDANLVAGNIKSGVSIFGVTGTYVGSGSSGGSGNNNVEAYAITSTNPSVNFKTTSGTIKIWGYGTISSSSGWGGSTTSLIAFDGDKYYKSAVYGSPSSTSLSLSISGGKLTGLPSGLSAISAIVTRGI
nr:MAG TPA: tail protein [Bacteriophage sp.]